MRGASVPLQFWRSMTAFFIDWPCDLWAVIANPDEIGSWVCLIWHIFPLWGRRNLSSTVSWRTVAWFFGRVLSGSADIKGLSITQESAYQLPESKLYLFFFFKNPVKPLTMLPSTSYFRVIITDIPITKGILPRHWLVVPKFRLRRWSWMSSETDFP